MKIIDDFYYFKYSKIHSDVRIYGIRRFGGWGPLQSRYGGSALHGARAQRSQPTATGRASRRPGERALRAALVGRPCGREKLGNGAPASGGMRSAAARDVVTARGRCRAGLSDFAGLAHDLEAAWNAPGTTAHARVASARSDLITDIIADVDEATREVVLTARRPAPATAGPRA